MESFPEHQAFLVSIISLSFLVALAAPKPSRKPLVPAMAWPCSQKWTRLTGLYLSQLTSLVSILSYCPPEAGSKQVPPCTSGG